jgi:hypothetical protein
LIAVWRSVAEGTTSLSISVGACEAGFALHLSRFTSLGRRHLGGSTKSLMNGKDSSSRAASLRLVLSIQRAEMRGNAQSCSDVACELHEVVPFLVSAR